MIMALQRFDELNTLSFDEYFGDIAGMTTEQRKQRVALAETLLDVFLYAFSYIEEIFNGGASDAVAEQELWEMLDADVLASIPDDIKYAYRVSTAEDLGDLPIDPAIKNYVSLVTASIAGYTVAHVGEYYATSYERAWNMAADQSQALWNDHDYKVAVASGKRFKTWQAILDKVTRPAHWNANGKKVRINDYFVVGGEAMRYPHDINASAENVISCRCWVIYS